MIAELARARDILEIFVEASSVAAEIPLRAFEAERRRKQARDASRWFKRDAKRMHAKPAPVAAPRPSLKAAPGSIQERRMLKRQARLSGAAA